MNKISKVFSIMLITAILVAMLGGICLATNPFNSSLEALDTQLSSANTDVEMDKLQTTAGKVLKAIRNISAVVAVVVISVLGIKYMMGSTQEKADYKKSFIPLIVGVVVIVAAASIATAIFSVAG